MRWSQFTKSDEYSTLVELLGERIMPSSTLTESELRKPNAPEREGVVIKDAQRSRSCAELVERAGRGGSTIVGGMLIGITCGLAILGIVYPICLAFAVISAVWLIGYEIKRMHNRLDAIVELSKHESKADPSE